MFSVLCAESQEDIPSEIKRMIYMVVFVIVGANGLQLYHRRSRFTLICFLEDKTKINTKIYHAEHKPAVGYR